VQKHSLESIGSALMALAALPERDLRMSLDLEVWRDAAEFQDKVISLLDHPETESGKRLVLVAMQKRLNDLLLQGEAGISAELVLRYGEQVFPVFRQRLNLYGQVLKAWPALWQAARELRESGEMKEILEGRG
jgi:hypothetical protein